MMYLTTRNWWGGEAPVPELIHVDCFGDSMMFGFGCLPDAALPPVLERQLNESCENRLFLVENWGVPGWNLWESWLQMRERIASGIPDLAIVSVCYNDAYLFERTLLYTNPARISQGAQDDFWNDARPSLAATFDDLAAVGAEHAVPILVLWLGCSPAAHPQIAIIAEECERVGLPFIDACAVFADLFGERAQETLSASDIDPYHLNGRAHEILGRHIVAKLKDWALPSRRAVETPLASLAQGIASVTDKMPAAGFGILSVARWVLGAIAAKQQAVRRFVPRERRVGELASLAALAAAWRIRRSEALRELADRVALEKPDLDHRLLRQAEAHIVAAGELLYAAERLPESALLTALHDHARLLDPSPAFIAPETLMKAVALLDEASVTLRARAALPDDAETPCEVAAMGAGSGDRALLGRAAHQLAKSGAALQHALEVVEAAVPATASLSSRFSAIAIAANRLRQSAQYLLSASAGFVRLREVPDYVDLPTHTTIDFYVTFRNDVRHENVYLFADIQGMTPAFPLTRDFHWLASVPEQRLYRLQVPLFLRGKLVLRLVTGASLELRLDIVDRIELYNVSDRRVVLPRESWWADRHVIYFERDLVLH